MENTKPCPFCGEQIQDTALNCKHCGKSLLESDSNDEMATNLYWDGFGDEAGISSSPQNTTSDDPEELIKLALSVKYNIVEEVGRGGMAIIYKAIQKNLNREVALKVLPKQFTHDEEYLARFHREAREVAKLNHPNIITIFDEGIEKDIHYLAMEFLQGNDLQQIIKETHTLGIEAAVSIISPIAEALDYLHSKGLVHRDIKSSNIFLDRETRPVLMDFGIARTTGNTKLTQAGTIIGTPEYMSPEQAEGKEVDGRSDLYSLGVVLYECLAGVVPFKAENPITVIRKIVDEKPESVRKHNSNIPKWLDEIILKMLEKNPADRIQSGIALSQSLNSKKFIIGNPTPVQSDKTVKISSSAIADSKKTVKTRASAGTYSHLGKQKPKSKAGVIFIISFILVLALSAVFYFTMFHPTEIPPQVTEKPKESVTTTPGMIADTSDNKIIDILNTQDSLNAGQEILAKDSIIQKHRESFALKTSKDTVIAKEKVPSIPIETNPQIDNAKIRIDKLNTQIRKLEKELAEAKDFLESAKKKYEHAKKMREKKMLSPGDLKAVEENYQSAEARVKQTENKISQLKKQL